MIILCSVLTVTTNYVHKQVQFVRSMNHDSLPIHHHKAQNFLISSTQLLQLYYFLSIQKKRVSKKLPERANNNRIQTSSACLKRWDFLSSLEICLNSEAETVFPSLTHLSITFVTLLFGSLSLKILPFKSSSFSFDFNSSSSRNSLSLLKAPPEERNLTGFHFSNAHRDPSLDLFVFRKWENE